jgi:2'-5' RNA ligase
VRWTAADNWHVTLRFLGEVDESELAHATAALTTRLADETAPHVELGPATRRLNQSVLIIPVRGLDALATAVIGSTARIGQPPAPTFTGHLTIARARGRGRIPAELAGQAIAGAWTAREVAIIQSHLNPQGARYETLATVALPV